MDYALIEKSILGSCLNENYLVSDSQIKSAFFSTVRHQQIYLAMQELANQNKTIDYITLLTVRDAELLGGANYILELQNFANSEKFDEYVEILQTAWREREKQNILIRAQQEDWSLEQITKVLDDLTTGVDTKEMSIKETLIEMAEYPFQPKQKEQAIQTGLKDLDTILGGLHDSELIIVAARPSMGKTDFMNHITLNVGWTGYMPIVFSLEMSERLIIERLIATTGAYNRTRMRDPYNLFEDNHKEKWMPTLAQVDRANIQLDDRAYLKISQIRAQIRKAVNTHPNLKPVVLIDYLQIIQPDDPRQNVTNQVGQISRDLKQIAKEFNCPVVCLSQLSRAVEQRQDKRPIMSDLRDSGNIEQDADVISFLYREDYYDKETEDANTLEIIVRKNRNGPVDTAKVAYRKETGRLISIDWGGR